VERSDAEVVVRYTEYGASEKCEAFVLTFRDVDAWQDSDSVPPPGMG